MGGADLQDLKTSLRDGGSPPHVRGGCSVAGRKNASTGFTPACAGRMTSDSAYAALYRVHPRMCGADGGCMQRFFWDLGSPPHVRGGFFPNCTEIFGAGFTPACAGRIRLGQCGGVGGGVHPRMCGADVTDSFTVTLESGSPPHVRGGFFEYPAGVFHDGFTPACAGRIFL